MSNLFDFDFDNIYQVYPLSNVNNQTLRVLIIANKQNRAIIKISMTINFLTDRFNKIHIKGFLITQTHTQSFNPLTHLYIKRNRLQLNSAIDKVFKSIES